MSFEAQKLERKKKKKEKIIAYPLKDAREWKILFEKRNTNSSWYRRRLRLHRFD